MPVDADVEGGYGAGGQGAGMGSAQGNQGSPSGDHPDNDPSTGLNYGANQTEADLKGFDFGNLNQIGIQGAFDNNQKSFGSPTGAHPDSTTNQHYGTGISYGAQNTLDDVDYGYYDTPNPDHSSVLGGPATMSGANMSPGYQGAVSPSQNPSSVAHDFDIDTALQNSVPTTGVSLTAPLGTESNALGMEEVASFTAPTSIDVESFDSMPAAPITSPGYQEAVNAPLAAPAQTSPHDFDIQAMIDDDNAAVKNAATSISINAPTTTPPVTKYAGWQFYSALKDDDATEKTKALEIEGFLDHLSRKNYTDTGFFSNLGILSPQLNQRQQIEQVKNFMETNKKGIDALNTAYSKQINENPGFRSLLPGYSLLNGVLAMMGIPGQHTHPAVQALYDKMVKLGMKEQEHGEDITQAACEAKGYKWDEGLQACFKSGGATADEDDEVYNPYTGMV